MLPPVAQFAASYGAGLWVGLAHLVPRSVVWVVAVIAVGMAVGTGPHWRGMLVMALALGGVVGAETARVRSGRCVARWSPGRHAAILRVHDDPGETGRTDGTVLFAPEGCGGTLRLRFAGPVPAGATVLAVGTFHPAGPLRVAHARVLRQRRSLAYVLRDVVRRRLRRLYGARAPVVDALVLGRRADLPTRLRQDFVAGGVAHLLAISGLHVGILVGWLVMLLRRCGVRRTVWLWAAALVWGYVALLGFPAPATRAAAFVSVYGIARWRQRRPRPGGVLAVAVLLVLAVSPSAATAVGTWLSVAAVWGTGWAGRLMGRGRRLPVAKLAAVSAGATLATAPVTAFAFGAVAPVGVLTNLFAVPLAGVAVPGVFASLIVGSPLAAGTGLTLAATEWVATVGSRIPGGHLSGEPGVAFALPWALLFGLVVWVVVRRPTWAVARRRVLALSAAGCWTWVVLGTVRGDGSGGELVMHFLDVGQGDAVAIQTPGGRWVLVDAGPRNAAGDAGRRRVVPFLRRHGVRALDLLVVSHGDADHLGGVPAVVRTFPTAMVLEPGQPLGTALYLEHLATIAGADVSWRPARAGDTVVLDGVSFAVLHPSAGWLTQEIRPNENSVVLHVAYGSFDALLTGDIGWPAESALVARVGQAELLKVGHHGSAGSSTPAWLAAVSPRAAVVSVGRNTYGHPAPEVLARLVDHGAALFRTDRGGTVTVRSDGRYFEITQESANSLAARLSCPILGWLRSRASSSNRNGCSRKPRENSPTSFTTWPSQESTSLGTSGGRGWSTS